MNDCFEKLTFLFSKIQARCLKTIAIICDVNTVLLRTFSTVLAVITLLLIIGTPVGWVVGIASCFGLAFCFKDYAEVTTSEHGGQQAQNQTLSVIQKIKQGLAIFLSVLCGVGLELLLLEGLVAFATTFIAPFSMSLSLITIIITAAIVLFTLPNDILFYLNCMRKFFKLPVRANTHVDNVKNKSRKLEFFYLVTSCITSSIMVLVGCVTTFVGIGASLGPVGLSFGLSIGLVLGLVGSVGNFFLQLQSVKELRLQFAEQVDKSDFFQMLTTFNRLYLKKLTERLTSGAMSLAYSVPIVQSIITSPLMKRYPIAITIVLSVIASISVTVTAFKVGFNYIKRILKTTEDRESISKKFTESQSQKSSTISVGDTQCSLDPHVNTENKNQSTIGKGLFYAYQPKVHNAKSVRQKKEYETSRSTPVLV